MGAGGRCVEDARGSRECEESQTNSCTRADLWSTKKKNSFDLFQREKQFLNFTV